MMGTTPFQFVRRSHVAAGAVACMVFISSGAPAQVVSTDDLKIRDCPAGMARNQAVPCGSGKRAAVAECQQRCCDLDALRSRALKHCRRGSGGGTRSKDYNSSISNLSTVADSDADSGGIAGAEEARERTDRSEGGDTSKRAMAKNFNSSRSNRGSVVDPGDNSDPAIIAVGQYQLQTDPQDSKEDCNKAGGVWVCDMGSDCFCFRELPPDIVELPDSTP